jgi:cobalt-zinc-cadmium efflux system outer membrane protein
VAYKREPNDGVFIGPTVELGLPIFNQHQAGIARATAESRRSQERVAALAVEIRSEAREASTRLAATYAMVQHYEKVMLPLQQSIVSETLKFYNGMLVGVYDLLLARQAQVQTARQYVSASKDFWIAWTDLERAVGGKIPVPAATSDKAPDEPAPSHQHGDKQP